MKADDVLAAQAASAEAVAAIGRREVLLAWAEVGRRAMRELGLGAGTRTSCERARAGLRKRYGGEVMP